MGSDKKRFDLTEDLKGRVLNCKKKVPVLTLKVFLYFFPDYDTVKKKSLFNNVWSLRLGDEETTKRIELAVSKFEKSKQDLLKKGIINS
jgi:hypothetical protein